jgi:hypothetical protein
VPENVLAEYPDISVKPKQPSALNPQPTSALAPERPATAVAVRPEPLPAAEPSKPSALNPQPTTAPAKPPTPAPVAEMDSMEKARREWIDEQRKTNPKFAPDIESWKELLTPEERKEVAEWEDLRYKTVARQGPDTGYKAYKLSESQKKRLAELNQKYAPRQQAEVSALRPSGEVAKKAEVKPPSIDDLTPELKNYQRKTPSKGTAERNAWEAQQAEKDAIVDPLYEQIAKLEIERDNKERYSKGYEVLEKRIQKLREKRDATESKYKGVMENLRLANREDQLESPNVITRLKMMDDMRLAGTGKDSGYERIKKLIGDAAKKLGATDQEAHVAGIDAYAYTVQEDVPIEEIARRRLEAIRAQERKGSIDEFLNTLTQWNNWERQSAKARLTNTYHDAEKFEEVKKEVLAEHQKSIDAAEALKKREKEYKNEKALEAAEKVLAATPETWLATVRELATMRYSRMSDAKDALDKLPADQKGGAKIYHYEDGGKPRWIVFYDEATARHKSQEVVGKLKPAATPTPSEPADKVETKTEGPKQLSNSDIYETLVGGRKRFAVPSKENLASGKRGFGDGLFDSREEAEKHIEVTNRIDTANAESRAKQKAKADSEAQAEATRVAPLESYLDTTGLSSMQRGKLKSALMKDTAKRSVANAKLYTGRRYEVVKQMVDEGYSPKTDVNGDKTEYQLEKSDGSFFDVTKAEHDYAKWLGEQDEGGAPKPVEPKPPVEPGGGVIETPNGKLKVVTEKPSESGLEAIKSEQSISDKANAPLERAMDMEKRFGVSAPAAHFFNVALDAVRADPTRWTTQAEGVQKEAIRAAVKAGGNLDEVGDLRLAKKIAARYLPDPETGEASFYDKANALADKPEGGIKPNVEKFSVNPARAPDEERWLKYGINRVQQAATLVDRILRPAMLRRSGDQAYTRNDSVIAVEPDLALDVESHYSGIEAFEKLFGKRIVFYRDNIKGGEYGGLSYSAIPDVTFVNSRDAKPWIRVAAHELFHQLRFERPDLYAQIVSELGGEIRQPNPRELSAYTAARYKPEDIIEEQLADFMADRFTEPEFWKRFSEQSPDLFQRAARVLTDWMSSVINWLEQRKYGASKYFKDIVRARNVMADALAKYAQSHGESEIGGEAKFSINPPEHPDDTSEAGTRAETIMMGQKWTVNSKAGTFDANSTAAALAHAKTVFDRLGLEVTPETERDSRQPSKIMRYWKFADFGRDDTAGAKLVKEVQKQINDWGHGDTAADHLAGLMGSIRFNYRNNTMPFSEPIKLELENLAQGYYSWHAAVLGAASNFSSPLLSIVKHLDTSLGRLRYDAFGGDAYFSFFGRILENFRGFFTPEEIEGAFKDHPALKNMMSRVIAQNHRDYAGRVYRMVQNQWKEKFAPKLSKLELDSRINEAAQSIIEEARNRFGIEPQPAKGKPMSPYEQLLHLVSEKNAGKVAQLMEGAVADAEYNAGLRAMQDAAKTTKDADEKEALTDHLALMAADRTVQPLPEYVEKGLDLPEYQNWKTVRDNWFNYSPVSLRLARKVISGDFKGTRFGDKKEKPADTRLDLNALAKHPEEEVQRVLDAHHDNLADNMEMSGATDAVRDRVRQLIQEEVADQLEKARARARDPMFRKKAAPGSKLTAQQAMAQQLNAGLFRDVRLDIPELVARVAEKSKVQKLLPKLSDVVEKILSTPAFRQSDLEANFVAHLIDKLGVAPEQAQAAWKVFAQAMEGRMADARGRALQKARSSFSAREDEVFPKSNPFWQKVERAVNAGLLDASEMLKLISEEHNWLTPTRQQAENVKRLVEQEQSLRTLTPEEESEIRLAHPDATPEEIAKLLETERTALEVSTNYQRAAIIRQLGVEWTRLTKPINFLKHYRLSSSYPFIKTTAFTRGNAQAANEYETLNLLTKPGFVLFRLPTHIATQLVLHSAARSVGRALSIRDGEIARKIMSPTGAARKGLDAQFWTDVHTALADSLNATLASLKPAVLSARAELLGRGESRNVDRLMSGINALERLNAKAKREADAGRPVQAVMLHLLNLPRAITWYISAIDHFQGKPVEMQELMHRIELTMRLDGRSRAEIEMAKDAVFNEMKAKFVTAAADARSYLESRGFKPTQQEVEEAAQNLARRRVYDRLQSFGLPADAFEQTIDLLKSTTAWQERTEVGLGGLVANMMRGVASAAEDYGVPTFMTRLSNAIGTGINYALLNTPFYKAATGKMTVKNPSGGSPWFQTDLDRNHRMVQSILGTTVGTTLGLLALSKAITVNMSGPKDKRERDEWIRQGHKPGTVEFNLPDGTFIPISLSVGPMSLYAPYLAAGGAVHDLVASRAKAQAKLDAEAKAKGLPAGKIDAVSALDVLAVAGSAMEGALMSSHSASGLASSLVEQGIPNAQKSVASFIAPLVPLLPAYQEISRAMGVQMDPKTASVWDYLVPLPTSPHRAVNVLGEPVETPSDIQRVVQTLTAGSYPFPVDPQQAAQQAAYGALHSSGYMPPAINPGTGYNLNGTFRPMNDAELQAYTIARGQNLQAALTALGPNATRQQAMAAYRQANAAALQSVGVTPTARSAGVRRAPAAATAHRAPVRAASRSAFASPRSHHALVHLSHSGTSHHRGLGHTTTSALRSHHKHALL